MVSVTDLFPENQDWISTCFGHCSRAYACGRCPPPVRATKFKKLMHHLSMRIAFSWRCLLAFSFPDVCTSDRNEVVISSRRARASRIPLFISFSVIMACLATRSSASWLSLHRSLVFALAALNVLLRYATASSIWPSPLTSILSTDFAVWQTPISVLHFEATVAGDPVMI